MWCVVFTGHLDVCQTLIKAGGKEYTMILDADGWNAQQLAEYYQHTRCEDVLIEALLDERTIRRKVRWARLG